MSRIGKQPITVPSDVSVNREEDRVTLTGPKGTLSLSLRPEVSVKQEGEELIVTPVVSSRLARALWGTTRSLLANMMVGVTEGYHKELEIQGVGYRGTLQGADLVLNVGFSHPVTVEAPDGITFSVDGNSIRVEGADKQAVGEIAAVIRSIRPPEPYKGKGIRYRGEVVRRKAGKRAVVAGE